MSRSTETPATRIAKTAKAFAGLTGALAFVAKLAAVVFAPTGLAALAVAVGFRSPPFIAVAAVLLASLAAVLTALHGIAYFWAWIRSDRQTLAD